TPTPASTESNTRSALDSVPLTSMRRFATRSSRFADSYAHGLNGRWATWANEKFRGHRVMP
ncbi:hypothetical protein FB446DRAFT_621339, partial [Lentinula raphanica]